MEPDELRNALWLGALLLAITSSYTLVKTARDSLFLSNLPASSLPFVYLAVGVFALVVSWLFGLLTHRMSPLRAFTVTALASAASLFAFSAGFTQPKGWLPWLFYVWVNAYGLILVSQFWMFTNSVSDPRVAKRIFGIVGGGGILGGLVGGFLATFLAQRVPLGWMVVVGAIVLAAVVPMVGVAVRHGRVRQVDEPTPDEKAPAPTSVPYVRWLALSMLCSVVVTGLLDFQLKTVVQVAYPTAAELARFFGWFYVGVNVIALLFQLIGTRWLLQRFGAGTASGVLPIGLVAGVTGVLLAPGLNSVLITRVWDQVLRFSLNKAAVELFYFPLAADVRRRAKAFIEAGIERFGDGIAGVLILAAGALLDTSPLTMAGIVAVLLGVWLVAWWRLKSGYVEELGRNLPRMSIDSTHGNVSLNERGVLKELVRALERPYEKVVLQSMALLEVHGDRLLTARLPKLLAHPSPKVRVRALELVVAGRTADARDQVVRLLHDPDPMVRLQALRAMCALGQAKPIEALGEYLDAEDPELRGTALTCLVEFAEDGELPVVRQRLEELIERGTPEDVARAAEALGARPGPSPLHDLLTPLVDSPEPAVRSAALRSVGKAGLRDWVPQLIHALGVRETEAAAHDGLVAFGVRVVGTLGDWLRDDKVPVEIRRVVPRVLGDVVHQDAIAALYRTRDRSDVLIQYRILKASNYIRNADTRLEFPLREVTEDIDYDAKRLLKAELHAISQQGARTPAERFLLLVLNERRAQSFDRIFRRLALVYPPEPMFAAFHGLRSENSRVRGNAAEFVESVLTPEHRTLVTPLLPDAAADARVELARERYGLTQLSPQASLVRLLEDDDPWLRTCALYVAGLRRERSLVPGVESNLESQDTRVRETAAWAKLQLVGA